MVELLYCPASILKTITRSIYGELQMRMLATIGWMILFIIVTMPASNAQEKLPNGTVVQYSGERGGLIVSRDSIVYFLTQGDHLFENDILRSKAAGVTTIVFNGCMFDLPAAEDIELDNEFCAAQGLEESSMATLAAEGETVISEGIVGQTANAPLIVGGVVLSAGGLAAATGAGGGGPTPATATGGAQANSVSQ